ncbi:unnamed protein product [Pleuronectes platessa]|uniref:Uncharacterized protein n=1 Tax=Pleuronectes platessa TaxID=8262 RepID=A0A9N7Z6T5_PLEPL|nr:unnamed protein product [Pleuronectes platessa]
MSFKAMHSAGLLLTTVRVSGNGLIRTLWSEALKAGHAVGSAAASPSALLHAEVSLGKLLDSKLLPTAVMPAGALPEGTAGTSKEVDSGPGPSQPAGDRTPSRPVTSEQEKPDQADRPHPISHLYPELSVCDRIT